MKIQVSGRSRALSRADVRGGIAATSPGSRAREFRREVVEKNRVLFRQRKQRVEEGEKAARGRNDRSYFCRITRGGRKKEREIKLSRPKERERERVDIQGDWEQGMILEKDVIRGEFRDNSSHGETLSQS